MDRSVRPPLANDLFDSRFDRVLRSFQNELVPILHRLRSLPPNRSLEQVLQELQQDAERYPKRLEQLMAARFYLQHVLHTCGNQWAALADQATNFVALFDTLAEWQHHTKEEVAVVTFNYDLMVEHALATVLGMQFNKTRDWMTGNGIRLFKLHGSVNWAHPARITGVHGASRVSDLVRAAGSRALVIDDQVFEMTTEVTPTSGSEVTQIPALAIPVVSKKGFECPSDHLAELINVLPTVTRILVIGWRATETDFVRLWKELVPPAQVIRTFVVAEDRDAAAVTVENLKAAGLTPASTAAIGDGFTGLVQGTVVRDLLRAKPD